MTHSNDSPVFSGSMIRRGFALARGRRERPRTNRRRPALPAALVIWNGAAGMVRRTCIGIAVGALLLSFTGGFAPAAGDAPDLLYLGGKVVTLDARGRVAEAVA